MRICLIGYRGNPYSGGQGIYIYHLSRELARLGHEVDVIVGPPYPRPLEEWARVYRVPNLNLWGRYQGEWLPEQNPFSLLKPWNLFDFAATRLRFFPEPLSFSFRALVELQKILKHRRYDILHDIQTLGYGMLAMRALGIPMVTTVHHPLTIDQREAFDRDRTLNEYYHTSVFFPVRMQRRVIRRLDHVITASTAGREAIEQDFKVNPERISIVPNGLDTEFFQNTGEPRQANTLLFVGNTDDVKKGAIFAVKALLHLPKEVTLRIVDEPYPIKTLLWQQVEKLGLVDRVTFTGRLSDEALRKEYSSCTLLVQPSLYEGFGLPAAEALACGTPVVATDVGAVGEVVSPDVGVLVAPGSPETLAKGIRDLLDDAPRREALSENSRERMVRYFSWPTTAWNTAAVYRRVLEESRAGSRRGAA